MKKRKLSRRQLRHLLMQEMRILSKRTSRKNQLNEGIFTTLGLLGLGALTTVGLFVAYHKPQRPEDNPDAYPEYHDNSLEPVYEDIGREVQAGKSPQEAVAASLQKNQSAAQKISTISQQNGGKSVESAIGSSAARYRFSSYDDSDDDFEEGDLQSRKYGAQDPTEAGYTGLGLPFPLGGSDDDSDELMESILRKIKRRRRRRY